MQTARLPKYLAEIDPFDSDSYREPIRGQFYNTFTIIPDFEGVEAPSVGEIIGYHPSFGFAARVLCVPIRRSWVRDKRHPDAAPALAYHYHNPWYEGPGGREDFILISRAGLARFTRKVRYVLAARGEKRPKRMQARRYQAPRRPKISFRNPT